MTLSAKVKYYAFLLAKIVIAVMAFYFIYQKISKQPLSEIGGAISAISFGQYWLFVSAVILSAVNWFCEISKWKVLSKKIRNITFNESFRIVLSSLVASIITPNKIGEYGAKVTFYKKEMWKKVLGFNFFGNMMQLYVTLLMGLFFYYFLPVNVQAKVPGAVLPSVLLFFTLLSLFLFRKNSGLQLPWLSKRVEISVLSVLSINDRFRILAISVIKYLAFSLQFLLLLLVFGVDSSVEYYSIITLNYFLISILPSIFFGDLLIRGSVAIFLFSLIGVNEIVVVTVVFIAWIFNFVIPALIGSLLILKTKQN
ncbi:MAG: lysylphosphatidylglycerol synthase domain-containing protein [Bacteroidota bacterium]